MLFSSQMHASIDVFTKYMFGLVCKTFSKGVEDP